MRAFLPRSICRMIGHRRSARRAHIAPTDHRWHSNCRLCGAPMRKEGLLGWQELPANDA